MLGSIPARTLGTLLLTTCLFGPPAAGAERARTAPRQRRALEAAVEADWALQERRLRRRPSDPASVRAALDRWEKLRADLSGPDAPAGISREALARARADLGELREEAGRLDELGDEARADLYRRIRWAARRLALENPLVRDRPIAFLERRRFVCQMLHEYLGYFSDYGDVAGGGVYVLERPGHGLEVRELVRGELGRGNFTTLSLSYDGRTLYFAFAPRARRKPDFHSPERTTFHIYAVGADGEGLRRLTSGPDDDFDPCELPDGGVAFISTRRGGFGRCHNPWEPLPTYTLHRMDRDGSNVRALSFHETNEWHPSVLADGRIAYSRWDYVDRSAANFHGIWVSNPDGTGAAALFGSYTARVNACYQPRAIPGSHRIAFIAGAHHAAVGGSLAILDPARAGLDPETGEDRFDAIEVLTPEVCFPEAAGWPGSYFHSPWPLSENYLLVSFSFDPLPGMGPGVDEDTKTGIYLFDRFGNLELLYREDGLSCMYPIPLAPRPKPPVVASALDPALGGEGEFLLADVRRSLFPLPPGRPIRELRVFQVFPKSRTHVANEPRIGHANAEPVRALLGTVPVEEDGSAYFRAPARKPLFFQAVDASGRAVQGMRSVAYLQPGERRGCVGCHEPQPAAPPLAPPAAHRRAPSEIRPGPDGTRPWNYARLVQPILDARCLGCHAEGGSRPVLDGAPSGEFTRSYESLRPYVRWFEWGGGGIDAFVATRPGQMPADESPLFAVLRDERHAEAARLSDEEVRRLYLWADGNAAFYGTYDEGDRLAARRGASVPLPGLE